MVKAVEPIKEPKPSANPLGVQYNNCTVNMYSSAPVAPMLWHSSVLPFFPPYPAPSFDSPGYYPHDSNEKDCFEQ